MKTIIAAVIGAALGLFLSHLLVHGNVYSLVIWGIFGLLIGYISDKQKNAIVAGATYGFLLSFFFMVFGYNGSDSVITKTPFFALLGLFGALCGIILSFAAYFVKKRVQK